VPLAVKASAEDYVPQTVVVETSFNDPISDVVFISNPTAQINAFVGDNFEITTTTETPLDEIEYKTIEPPEDGWTLELLNEVTYINGQDIDLPFCVNDLGEDFSFGDVEYSSVSDKTKINIYYKNEKACVCYISHLGKDFDEYDKITTFMLMTNKNESELDLSKFLVINGYNLSMDEDIAIKRLGSDYTKYVNNDLTYEIGTYDDNFYILFNTNERDINTPKAENTLILHLWSEDYE
jgi:hypothetical protein